MTLAPIVLFVYNRPWHTQQTIEALKNNELASESELFIYADAAKNKEAAAKVDEVLEYIKTIDGFKKVIIIKRDENFGLADSIIDGVTTIINQYGRIIVMEDDLVTSPYFLKFMNKALLAYQHEEKVASIHGYVYPIENLPETFFIRGADCWGWATWQRAWNLFEPDGKKLLNELEKKKLEKKANFNNTYNFTQMLADQIDGKNNSWAVRWYMSIFLKDMLTLYPGVAYVQNIGTDNSGTHCEITDIFHVKLSKNYHFRKISIQENKNARRLFEIFHKKMKNNFIRKVLIKIKKIFNES